MKPLIVTFDLGDAFRKARKLRRMKAEEIYRRVGLDKNTISRIENGGGSPETRALLAKALEVSLESLEDAIRDKTVQPQAQVAPPQAAVMAGRDLIGHSEAAPSLPTGGSSPHAATPRLDESDTIQELQDHAAKILVLTGRLADASERRRVEDARETDRGPGRKAKKRRHGGSGA